MATLYTNRILTAQMALARDICSTVYSGASGYAASVNNLAAITTSNDNVFGDNSADGGDDAFSQWQRCSRVYRQYCDWGACVRMGSRFRGRDEVLRLHCESEGLLP